MGVEHSLQLIWGLPWNELTRGGKHIEDWLDLPEDPSALDVTRALDKAIERPYRARGWYCDGRWSISAHQAHDNHDPSESFMCVGMEVSYGYDRGSELLGNSVEQHELEARRQSTIAHLRALGITEAPRLLLVTGSG